VRATGCEGGERGNHNANRAGAGFFVHQLEDNLQRELRVERQQFR
jgi:hypothetical protein